MPPFLLRPRAEDNPNTIRPYGWYDKYKDFWNDLGNSEFPPAKLISGMMGTRHQSGVEGDSEDLQNQVLNSINPLEAPAAFAAASIIPKNMLRARAKEVAEKAFERFKAIDMHNTADAVATMATKHPFISGNFHNIAPELLPSGTIAGFKHRAGLLDADILRSLIENPDSLHQHTEPTIAGFARHLSGMDIDGRVKALTDIRTDNGILPRVAMGFGSERRPIAEIYKDIRHEFSHAADFLYKPENMGESFSGNDRDPRYWVSRPEVRARAVEQNYGRDMGITDANKERAVIDGLSSDGTPTYDINAARSRYGDKIAAQLSHGTDVAERWARGTNVAGESMYPPGLTKARMEDSEKVARDTWEHYFEDRVNPKYFSGSADSNLMIPSRLKKPEKFNTMGIPDGDYTDMMAKFRGW